MLLKICPGHNPATRTVGTPFGPVEISRSDAYELLQFTEQHRDGCARHSGSERSELWRTVAPRPLAAGQPSAVRLACHGPAFGSRLSRTGPAAYTIRTTTP
jgi:hypothetical protein